MSERLSVLKTYKLYINGAFPRSESGRSFEVNDHQGAFLANAALASRKDLRDAVSAARNAQNGWSKATAYNRGQVLYRIAEVMEGRRDQFVEEITSLIGCSKKKATKEVDATIDRWVWYAGWSDKLSATFGNTNPVAGPFFNFTVPEPVGVVGIIPATSPTLLSISSAIAAAIVSGNTAVVIAPSSNPLSAITLGEVCATSDVPAGVINILTGSVDELSPWLAAHMDIDALDLSGVPIESRAELAVASVENLKRIAAFDSVDASPLATMHAFLEAKTIWHPIGI